MSGLELLGALSGAAQLVDAGLEIIKLISTLCSKLLDAPASIKKRTIEIQHLIEIARLIQQSPSLQTTLISSLLMSCIEKANELRGILASVSARINAGKVEKYWKALGGVMKEKRILEICESLEQEKSALILCIASIDS
jgi:N-terminal domain on NACHT_NTPase and P-loop NTPases